MTTAEITMRMVGQLTESEMLAVQKQIKQILAKREDRKAPPRMQKYDEARFAKMVDASMAQYRRGEVFSWDEIKKATHEKYGL